MRKNIAISVKNENIPSIKVQIKTWVLIIQPVLSFVFKSVKNEWYDLALDLLDKKLGCLMSSGIVLSSSEMTKHDALDKSTKYINYERTPF
ncbi:MAG: hypothetical protein C4581_01165 [Nitrospiraceae bacterium]|nr:MAG: hypothetical protein C4581_01165 [Nitrospiraceae bacterium]